MATGNKDSKHCYTCQYWNGSCVTVKNRIHVEYSPSEQAICNKTGFRKSATAFCREHEKRYDF